MIIRSLKNKSWLDRTDIAREDKKVIKIALRKIVIFPLKGNIFALILH